VKFRKAGSFDNDWARLSGQHKALALAAVPAFNAACEEKVKDPGTPWPNGLRVHGVKGYSGVFAMTWCYEQPDGRATFEWIGIDGARGILWRRIGDHGIYQDP